MELTEAINKLESFKELKKDWNGYNAEPFSEKLINKALELLKQTTPIPEVFPTANNSIQFEWEKTGLYLEIEIFENKVEIFAQSKYEEKLVTIGE